MSKLEKIYISGIRSYAIDKDGAQSFEFFSPVTLFLGQNGCGKTTIIESVKHALTGEFPYGSTKYAGQAFVSDPRLYQLTSVKGCIKLVFSDTRKKPTIISRTLKLENIGSKAKFTSMDATYEYEDVDNIRRQRTVKLADCKQMISMLLGVGEPVLSNVLLCHQEDSLWPLSEDSNVKKKFDLIFDSSKFEAVVDNLQKTLKHQNAMILDMKKELVVLREHKRKYTTKQESLASKKENMRLLNAEANELKEELGPLRKRQAEVHGMEQSILSLHKLKLNKEGELKTNRMMQKALLDIIKNEFEGTNDELYDEIQNFHVQMSAKQLELKELEAQTNNFKRNQESVRMREKEKQTSLAKVNERINTYKQKIVERDNLIKNLLLEYDSSSQPDEFDETYELIKTLLLAEQSELEDRKSEFAEKESELEKKVEIVQEEYMKMKGEVSSKQKEIEAIIGAKHDVECQLENASTSDAELVVLDKKVANASKEIDQLKASFDEGKISQQIERNRKKIRELNEYLEELNSDLKKIMNNTFIENSIDSYTNDISKKEVEIRKLRNKYRKEFELVFNGNIPSRNLKTEVEILQKKHYKDLETVTMKLKKLEHQLATSESDLRSGKKQLETTTNEIRSDEAVIRKVCGSEDLNTKYNEVVENNVRLQNKKSKLNSCDVIYSDFITEVTEKKCCPLCETKFSKNTDALIRKMNDKITAIPRRVEALTKELQEGKALEVELERAKLVNARLLELKAKRLTQTSNLEQLSSKADTDKKAVALLNTEKDRLQSSYNACVTMLSGATLIDQYVDDVSKAEAKIAELKSELLTVASNRTQTETETVVEETKDEIRHLSDECERLTKKIDSTRTRLHDLRNKKAELVDAQLKLQKLMHSKPQLVEKMQELDTKETELREAIEDLELRMFASHSSLDDQKSELKQFRAERQQVLDEHKSRLQSHRSMLNEVDKLLTVTKESILDTFTKQQNELLKNIEDLNSQRLEIDKRNEKNQTEIAFLKEEIHDCDNTEKLLHNNKKLREHRKMEEELQKSLSSVEDEIGAQNYQTIEAEKQKVQEKIGHILVTLSNIDGQKKTLEATILEIEKELKSYAVDPFLEYKRKKSKLKVKTILVADLRKGMDAISNGLCQFHKDQLLSINLRLKELWRTVYKGNDIDCIMIESGETVSTAARRTYSYCIMQKKGDTVIPMRGKCSAGQKVLACILVRIALAEHFSSKCGIFALDEPTTNLDRENIKSLSNCIARLINAPHKRNAQFLIITHDEDFLDALREEGALREFYRVSRNHNRNTIISMEVI